MGGRVRRWAIWPLVLVATALGSYGAWSFHRAGGTWFAVIVDLLVGWGFVAVGLVVRRRQPDNHAAHLMVAEGLTWFLPNLEASGVPVLMFLGIWLASFNEAVMAHLVFAFPTGRLASRAQRAVVAAAYLLALGGGLLYLDGEAIPNDPFRCPGCSTRLVELGDSSLLRGAESVAQGAAVALGLCILVMLVGGWVRSTRIRRLLLTPVWLSSSALLLLMLYHGLAAADMLLPADAASALTTFANLGFLALPVGFGVVSLRLRMARAAVGERLLGLGSDLSTPALGEALARAVGDPSLELLPWDEEAGDYRGRTGSRALPGRDGRAATRVDDHQGQPRALILHDPALAGEADLLGAVVAAASLGLEREWHQRQLAASATRLLEATDAERQRVERDLHDGAQQRFLALGLTLRSALKQLGDPEPAVVREMLVQATDELREAMAELRDLARGVFPAILTERGLQAAIDSLAMRAPVPVAVRVEVGRLPAVIETTIYLLVSETLANVARHALASRAGVSVVRQAGEVVVEVMDDGIGGADPTLGSGLRGLRDRVAALGGTIAITSRTGMGTLVRARLPCE